MAWWLFQNAVVTAVLALGVLAMCRFVRIGPVARHALWVLVLLKFVTPPIVVWPWAAPDPFGLATVERAAASPVITIAAAIPPIDRDRELPIAAGVGVVANKPASPRWASVPGVVWIWVLGAVVLLALECIRLVRLERRVRTGSAADPWIVRRVAELSKNLGLKPIPVVVVAGHGSPMIWGFGRTRLLWPEGITADATDACIDGLIVHELAHVKRRDHLVGWVELAAAVVWWWNPLFWFVRACLREQAELACDAWVISTLPNGRRAYAESLLALSGAALRGTPPPAMAVVGIRASSRRVLERRLVMIMKGRAPLRLPVAGVLTIALIAAATLPAWATGQQAAPPPPTPAAPPAVQPVSVPPAPAQKPSVPVRPSVAAPASQVPVAPTPMVKPSQARPAPVFLLTPAAATPAQAAAPKVATPVQRKGEFFYWNTRTQLPAEGQQLLTSYNADVDAIYKEIEGKIEARRQAAIKALEALQEQFTKAGKLDEAVAIRDYLRAGGPPADQRVWWTAFNKGK